MRSRAGERARDFVILLAHEPAFAAFAPDYADLILAGHTHGGQMFPALTGRFVAHQNKLPAARGAMMVNGIPLVITSGVGTSKIGRASCREQCVSTCRSRWSPYH